MPIFVIWQSIVTLDSIRNSCDVFDVFDTKIQILSIFAYLHFHVLFHISKSGWGARRLGCANKSTELLDSAKSATSVFCRPQIFTLQFSHIFIFPKLNTYSVVNFIFLSYFDELKKLGSSNKSTELSGTLGHLFFHRPAVFRKLSY